MAARFRCPICKQAVSPGAVEFPFCSQRCRTEDLANWAREKYTISSPLFDPDTEEKPPPPAGDADDLQ